MFQNNTYTVRTEFRALIVKPRQNTRSPTCSEWNIMVLEFEIRTLVQTCGLSGNKFTTHTIIFTATAKNNQ